MSDLGTARPPKPGENRTCPHCGVLAHFSDEEFVSDSWHASGGDYQLVFTQALCPSCNKPTVVMSVYLLAEGQRFGRAPEGDALVEDRLVWPLSSSFRVPDVVDEAIRNDFLEAAAVLPISPKASAALSRRCLQAVLTAKGAKNRRLSKQITEIGARLSPDLQKDLEYVKQVGDFSAHPQKDETTGEILDVEAGEAEWNLFVLQGLFNELYVRPSLSRAKRKALNQKLQAAGRKPIGDEDDLPNDDQPATELLTLSANPTQLDVERREQRERERREQERERRGDTKLDIDDEFPPDEDLPF